MKQSEQNDYKKYITKKTHHRWISSWSLPAVNVVNVYEISGPSPGSADAIFVLEGGYGDGGSAMLRLRVLGGARGW